LNRAERKKAAKNVRAGTGTSNGTDLDTDLDGDDGIRMDGPDPFGDENVAVHGDGHDEDGHGDVHGPIMLTEEDIEIEAPTSTEMANMPTHERSWSKFKPSKDRRNKGKDKTRSSPPPAHASPFYENGNGNGSKSRNGSGMLGNGAAIVQKPRDAFPDSPHHRAADALLADKEETEVD
jgi:hypothetical protein